jgi:hypothetical protein
MVAEEGLTVRLKRGKKILRETSRLSPISQTVRRLFLEPKHGANRARTSAKNFSNRICLRMN